MRKTRKPIALILLAAAILAGCGKKVPTPTTEPVPSTEAATQPTAYTNPQVTLPYDYTEPEATYENGSAYETFGTPVTFEAVSDKWDVHYMINLPDDSNEIFANHGALEHYMILADGREILYGYLKAESADSLEDIDEAIFAHVSSNFGSGAVSGSDIVAEQSVLKEINGRQMKKLQLRISVQSQKWKIVAYAVELKAGGYAFFMAGCPTSNSNFILTRQTAENMALTFMEE